MTPHDLQILISNGEDTRQQFKRDFNHVDGMAAELVAFTNTAGGKLIIGVADNGDIEGLDANDVHRLNQMISNAASQHVKPPINPLTTNIRTEQGLVMIIEVEPGLNKPYMDGQGRISHLPAFIVKAVAFPGNALHDNQYNDSEDIDGTLPEQYQRCTAFIKRNLRHVQGEKASTAPANSKCRRKSLKNCLSTP